jgi:flavin-binding protein dodecin
MKDPTHKKVEVVGTSAESYAQATRNAVAKASESLHNLEWFEVGELRGRIRDG